MVPTAPRIATIFDVRLALLAAISSLCACVPDVDFSGTSFRCQESNECPSEQICIAQACEPRGLTGTVMSMSFEDGTAADRSGRGNNGVLRDAIPAEGRYGGGLFVAGTPLHERIEVPDHESMYLGNHLTIESWVRREPDGDGQLAGDAGEEYRLEVSNNGVVFDVTATCGQERVRAVSQRAMLPPATWTHVAVTWDGRTVRFYIDGTLVDDVAVEGQGCQGTSDYLFGSRGGGGSLAATIDELKLFDFVKTEDEIRASMMHDPSAMP